MTTKLEHPSVTLSSEAVHQLQNLLCIGSALAAHGQRYGRSHVIKYEISPAWNKQLVHVKSWLEGYPSVLEMHNHDPRA